MREHVRTFVELAADCLPLAGPVYEFGSFLVEGQRLRADLRGVFPGRPYVGCDLRAGPGVDRIEDVSQLSLADGVAGTVLCLDTLEHVFEARRAVDELIRVLAPGGVLLISVPFSFRVHNFPDDYWRMTPGCLDRLLAPLEASVVGSVGLESDPHTVLALAAKAPLAPGLLTGINRLLDDFSRRLDGLEAAAAGRHRVRRWLTRWTRSKGDRRREEEFYASRFTMHLPAQTWYGAELARALSASPGRSAGFDSGTG